MAESTLSITYNTLRREVGHYMGWFTGTGRDPNNFTAENNTDFDDILARGLRMFYFPPTDAETPNYEWSFLSKEGSVTLASTDFTYDMPDDFCGVVKDNSVTYASGQNQRAPQITDESFLRKMQAMDSQSGYPKYYSISPKTPAPTTGQRWEMKVYPTPTASQGNGLVLTFRYPHTPDTMSSTNIYPIAGAQYGETILAAVLAAAEYKHEDDPAGPFYQKFLTMLNATVRADENMKNHRGGKD